MFLGRNHELQRLQTFLQQPGSGFTYMRGRRRVGKSWLLKKFQQKQKSFCFYFSGAADENTSSTIKRFVIEWEQLAQTRSLSELSHTALIWNRIFQEMSSFAQTKQDPVILIFDEIQWIAKKGSGFVGNLKEAWLDWEKSGNVKVIVCGSSNKFFNEYTGGEEKILRGIKTSASIWVEPFTLSEVKEYYFPNWSLEEICLTYMMFGGIPYYLTQIQSDKGFVHAINHAAFIEDSIFLEEIDEVLQMEFNKRGVKTVKKILSSLGQDGSLQKTIHTKTGISLSTLSEVLERLVDYGLVFKKLPAHKKPERNESGYLYYMKDFFLNFYFQILEPLQTKIKGNTKGLLFPYACLQSNTGFYIPNFSGKAFELLIRCILENKNRREGRIFERLQLLDENYNVSTYWDKHTQIDLIVEHHKDRLTRILECKWISSKVDRSAEYINELLSKSYPVLEGFTKKYFLVLSQDVSKSFRECAEEKNIGLINLSDLCDRS